MRRPQPPLRPGIGKPEQAADPGAVTLVAAYGILMGNLLARVVAIVRAVVSATNHLVYEPEPDHNGTKHHLPSPTRCG